MSELAYRAMTLEEFLRWDDGTDTHYELISGFPDGDGTAGGGRIGYLQCVWVRGSMPR